MQGVFINGSRPPTKKYLTAQVDGINKAIAGRLTSEEGVFDPYSITIEATSLFGNEFDGSLAEAVRTDHHGPFYIVGPDPRTSRKWYATLTFDPKKKQWQVK